jgi:hypothetical protein
VGCVGCVRCVWCVGCVGCVGVCWVCGGCGGVGVWGVWGVVVWGHSLRSTFHRLHLLRLWTPTIFILDGLVQVKKAAFFTGTCFYIMLISSHAKSNTSLAPSRWVPKQQVFGQYSTPACFCMTLSFEVKGAFQF